VRILRRLVLHCLPLVVLAAAAAAGPAGAAPSCVFPTGITNSGTTATGSFYMAAGCTNVQVSLVSISYASGTGALYKTTTGFFTGPGTFTLQVELPCGTHSEADLELGPPALFPPLAQDLLAVPFLVDCQGVGTLTIGYWKNHTNWPITTLPLGAGSISQAQALNILNTPPRGDATIILSQQLIGAVLNVAAGAASSCVLSTGVAANTLLAQYPPGSGLKTSTTDGQTAVALAATLDQYNNGMLCAPHQN
jgi:hypothetical protein